MAFSKERFLEVLKEKRYNYTYVACWLDVSKVAVSKKVSGDSKWTLDDILILIERLGKKKVDYIFFS